MTIKSLDGLRGIAVLLVLLSHMSNVNIHLHSALNFSGTGKAGVYLFFTLSAFLLTWQALNEKSTTLADWRYWLGYLVRRVLRIYPLYIPVLLTSLLLTLNAPGYSPALASFTDVLAHLTLIAGNSIYWAIPVEFKYYLLLPGVTLVLLKAQKIGALPTLALIALTLASIHLIWPPTETPANSISLPPYLTIFLLGSYAALVCRFYPDIFPSPNVFSVLGYLSLIMAMLTIPSFFSMLTGDDVKNQHFHKWFLFYGIVWSTAVVASVKASRNFTWFLETAICRFIGRISFSIYLWHFPIIRLVDRHLEYPASVKFVLVVILTFGLSYISYRIIERPFITWGHKKTSKEPTEFNTKAL